MRKRLRIGVWLVAVGFGFAIALYLGFASNRRQNVSAIYRIGWENVPPYQIKGENGTPTGFAVEVIREAARRRGIRLEWVWSPESSEASLRSGRVDLWPLITITNERKRFIHISEPYIQHEHYLMVRAGSPYSQARDLAGATITHQGLPINRRLVADQILPSSILVAKPSVKEAIEAVCRGSADAAFVDEFASTSALLAGLACGDQPLRMIWLPALRTQLGVGATFRAATVADEIREEIAAIARDGELTPIMNRWGYYLPQHLESMNALLQADRLKWRLIYLVAFLAALSVAAVLAAIHILRQRNRIEREITERKQAEQTVREWERRFRDLLEGVQMVAIIIDLKSGVSFCNKYGLSLGGWTREEVIGRPAEELLDDGYLRQLTAATHASPTADRLVSMSECALLTKNGQRRWIQWTSTILRDTTGRAVGFASLGEDVTELKRLRAEAATRESEERFRAIFRQAAIGVAQADLDGTLTLVNDRYCAVLGFTREELIGKNFRSYTYPDDVDPQLVQMGRLLAGEIFSFSHEKRKIQKDGSVVWAKLNGSLIRDQDDRPKQYIFVVEDVTERKQAEAALRESEERFRNMADTAPVMIWVSGPDARCTFVNKGWLNFTGRTMEEESGEGWAQGVHPDDIDRCRGTYMEAFEARRTFQMEYRLRSADGEYRWVRDEGVPRLGPGGAFAGYIGTCVDVTNLKRDHEAEVARQKLESVGRLAGGIAHDFNNLLGSIVADTELVKLDLPPNSPACEGIARVNAVAQRAAEIVRELLAYAGDESAVFEMIDVSTVVGEMIELLKVSILKRATLKVDLPRNLPAVWANAAQIRQVVLNLVTNASEALGPEGGIISIAMSLTRVSQESWTDPGPSVTAGDYLKLEISDTGGGMAEDVRTRIFDPFFTTKFTGRGLGLAVVQGIIHRHGGGIHVVSAPNQGTRFEILLPSSGEPAPAEHIAQHRPDREVRSAVGTILFVEDESSLQVPVSKMLQRQGFSVIEAGDGVTAVELFRADYPKIDVVLLDMTLPGKSGPEVFSEILDIQPDVKVIFTTAYSQQTALSGLPGRKRWEYIQKPYQFDDLLSLLQRVCRRAKEGRGKAATPGFE